MQILPRELESQIDDENKAEMTSLVINESSSLPTLLPTLLKPPKPSNPLQKCISMPKTCQNKFTEIQKRKFGFWES